jgi:hypothetical protein
MGGAQPKFQLPSSDVDHPQSLVDGGGFVNHPKGVSIGAAAREEGFDNEAIRFRDKVLREANVSQANCYLSFSFHKDYISARKCTCNLKKKSGKYSLELL